MTLGAVSRIRLGLTRDAPRLSAARESGTVTLQLRPTRGTGDTITLIDANGGATVPPTGDVWSALEVEADVLEGDEVGIPYLHDSNGNAPCSVAVGLPDDERDAAVSSINAAAYFANNTGTAIATDPGEFTLGVYLDRTYSAVEHTLFALGAYAPGAAGFRLAAGGASSATRIRMMAVNTALTTTVNVNLATAHTGGPMFVLFSANRTGNTRNVRIYDGAGALLTASAAAAVWTDVPIATGIALGVNADGSAPMVASVNSGARWAFWSSGLSIAQMDAAALLGRNGFGDTAAHFWKGMRSGVVDPSLATRLVVRGTGAGDVTAELQP